MPHYFESSALRDPAVRQYCRVERYEAEQRLGWIRSRLAVFASNVFPNFSFVPPLSSMCVIREESWAVEKELSGEAELAYFDEDLRTLQLRVARLETGMAWAENPPSRTRHLITNVEVEPGPSVNEYQVESCFIVYQSRLEAKESLFVGYRSDMLRRVEGGLKIARRKIVLDSGLFPAGNLSIFF